ncbi:MAG: SET domain-containing protein [bacterium]|nr:SET domain-containing protein [bacterium]
MRTRILQARFAVRKSKPGMGYGLFATSALRKGDFILEYKGRRIPTPMADTLKTKYLFEIDKEWTIDGSLRTNIARYINHSCKPNCEADIRDLPAPRSARQAGGRIVIFAKRDIATGEELSIDYGEEYFDEFIKPVGCRCPQCEQISSKTQTPLESLSV